MDALGFGTVLLGALCIWLLPCIGMSVLFAIGLVRTIAAWPNRHSLSQRDTPLWIPFTMMVIGGIGVIALGGPIIVRSFAVQQTMDNCVQISITPDYHLITSGYVSDYGAAVLKRMNGESIDLPSIHSYTVIDHYLVGRTAEPDGGYFWFDLNTEAVQRFLYTQFDGFAKSLEKLGIAEVPTWLTINEHCGAKECQPCLPGAQVERTPASR